MPQRLAEHLASTPLCCCMMASTGLEGFHRPQLPMETTKVIKGDWETLDGFN